jgi:hypothetical protein
MKQMKSDVETVKIRMASLFNSKNATFAVMSVQELDALATLGSHMTRSDVYLIGFYLALYTLLVASWVWWLP